MRIISSQHFVNWDIVEEKMQELEGCAVVEIPCWDIGEIDGEEYAIQADKHHTLAAARELGIDIRYVHLEEPEGLSGDDSLVAHFNDGDWYDVESSNPAEDVFNLIW